MKKSLSAVTFVACLVAGSASVVAQSYVESKITKEDGSISLVNFKQSVAGSAASKIFKEVLNIPENAEMRLYKSENDFTGRFVDEKYQMYFNNIKVEFAVYNLHYLNGKLSSMNGEIYKTDGAVTTPSISAAAAFNHALNYVHASRYMWEDAAYMANSDYKKPNGELVLLPIQQHDSSYRLQLAYKFDIYAAEPLSRAEIYVDAETGRIIGTNAIMKHHGNPGNSYAGHVEQMPVVYGPENKPAFAEALVAGTAATRYSGTKEIETTHNGTNYILHDTTRGNGVRTYNLKKSTTIGAAVEFTDNDNNWSAAEFDNALFDNAALDAHWGVEKTYDYFKTTFNRNSYDNAGAILKSYIHYGNAYENAGWSGTEMIYGDGASTFKPLTAFDVTAHELGHAVCQSTANLVYAREAGAMNEGFSDIWGAVVEYTYAPEKQNFLIGEEITKAAPGYLRSLSNPKVGLSAQPDTYRGINWVPATVEEGCASPSPFTNDNCGVHTNSGVLNHWYYILTQGKTGVNDKGHAYSVTGIGFVKSAQIAYRLETNYLTPNSVYIDARNFGIKAAQDLFGIDSPEAIATQNAFYAVGLGVKYLTEPDVIPPTDPTNLVASGTTGSSTKLNWDASTDAEGVAGYQVFKDGTKIADVTATNYKATGLSQLTTYEFKVRAIDVYDNLSGFSNVVSVTTTDVPDYCTSTSSNTTDERIQRVQFANINNPSTGTAGYEDFTHITTDVKRGNTYTITITPQWTSTSYNEGYAVYIDYNSDGDFSDAGEVVFTKPASKTSPVTGSITIPMTAQLKPVRMRVSMKFNGIPGACENFTYGQVEDYTINIVESLATAETNASKDISIYPNPVKEVVKIQSKTSGEYTYQVINAAGQVVLHGKSMDKTINVQSLVVGNYILKIENNGVSTSHKFIKK